MGNCKSKKSLNRFIKSWQIIFEPECRCSNRNYHEISIKEDRKKFYDLLKIIYF
jgi:hypothetical protein